MIVHLSPSPHRRPPPCRHRLLRRTEPPLARAGVDHRLAVVPLPGRVGNLPAAADVALDRADPTRAALVLALARRLAVCSTVVAAGKVGCACARATLGTARARQRLSQSSSLRLRSMIILRCMARAPDWLRVASGPVVVTGKVGWQQRAAGVGGRRIAQRRGVWEGSFVMLCRERRDQASGGRTSH